MNKGIYCSFKSIGIIVRDRNSNEFYYIGSMKTMLGGVYNLLNE